MSTPVDTPPATEAQLRGARRRYWARCAVSDETKLRIKIGAAFIVMSVLTYAMVLDLKRLKEVVVIRRNPIDEFHVFQPEMEVRHIRSRLDALESIVKENHIIEVAKSDVLEKCNVMLAELMRDYMDRKAYEERQSKMELYAMRYYPRDDTLV